MAIKLIDGVWYSQFSHRGRAHTYAIKDASTREEAIAAEEILRTDIKASPKTSSTVEDWGWQWIADRRARGLSAVADDLGRLRNHVWPSIGRLKMSSVTSDVLRGLVEELDVKVQQGALSWKTARNIWGVVSKSFDDAAFAKTAALRVLEENPANGVRGPDQGDEKAKEFLYPSEFLSVWQCAKVPERRRHLYALAIYTYLRAGELTALERTDVDIVRRVLRVTKATNRKTGVVESTKSGDSRRVPLEVTLAPLVERMAWKGGLWAPPDEDRAELLRADLQRAGVTRESLHETTKTQLQIRFHDLRATGITWRVVRGDDPVKIQHAAGHKNFSTTQQYVRLAEVFEKETFGEVFPALF